MNYRNYNLDDFLSDNYFVEWVKNPSPESEYFWKNWMSKHPEKADTVSLAKEIISSLAYENEYLPTHSEKIEVLENVIKESSNDSYPFFERFVKVAAVALMVIGLSFWAITRDTNPELVEATKETIIKTTLYGEKKAIVLPDGTEVKLNYGSRIEYPSKFKEGSREVTLMGEAFFDVKPNPDQPFIITSNNVKTIVLGTSFDVKAYADDDEINVVVATGKVRVQKFDDNSNIEDVMLLPNEMVSLNKITGRLLKEKCDIREFIDWREGKLSIRKASFEEVVEKLKKWYGVDILVSNDLRIEGKYNGEFDNLSLEYVLKGLSFSHMIDFEINDKTVTIKTKTNEKN